MGTQEGAMGTGRREGGLALEAVSRTRRRVSASLVWMETSAGRCSRRCWGAELEPLLSAQAGETWLICIPRFPGILNKYFPKLGTWLGNHLL